MSLGTLRGFTRMALCAFVRSLRRTAEGVDWHVTCAPATLLVSLGLHQHMTAQYDVVMDAQCRMVTVRRFCALLLLYKD